MEFVLPDACRCAHDERKHMLGQIVLEQDPLGGKLRMYYADGEFCPTCRMVIRLENRVQQDIANLDDHNWLEEEWNTALKDSPDMCFFRALTELSEADKGRFIQADIRRSAEHTAGEFFEEMVTKEVMDNQARSKVEDLLDKAMEQMVKLTGCSRGSITNRMLLIASVLAILDAGGQVRWDGELREESREILERKYNEEKEKLNVGIKEIFDWFNRHTNATGVGPTGPPCMLPESMAKKVKTP